MVLRIVCMCGYAIQGDDDDELWRTRKATWESCTRSW
jgi:hypothetical protein